MLFSFSFRINRSIRLLSIFAHKLGKEALYTVSNVSRNLEPGHCAIRKLRGSINSLVHFLWNINIALFSKLLNPAELSKFSNGK